MQSLLSSVFDLVVNFDCAVGTLDLLAFFVGCARLGSAKVKGFGEMAKTLSATASGIQSRGRSPYVRTETHWLAARTRTKSRRKRC